MPRRQVTAERMAARTLLRCHYHYHRDEDPLYSVKSGFASLSSLSSASPALAVTLTTAVVMAVMPIPALASDSYPWAGPVRAIVDPLLLIGQFGMLLRVVMSWDPAINPNKMPYLIITFPTEPFLVLTREVVPPAFGVDISPIVWVGILSFFREIFFGQQGLFILMERS